MAEIAFKDEIKGIVTLAVRNSQLEDLHAGKECPTCRGHPEYSRISDNEMRDLMRDIVNRLYTLLLLKEQNLGAYIALLKFMTKSEWDDPKLVEL